MSEKYIKKQDALNVFIINGENWKAINAIPAEDVESVVRCGECIKFGRHDCVMGVEASRTDYCSSAERRERSGSGE